MSVASLITFRWLGKVSLNLFNGSECILIFMSIVTHTKKLFFAIRLFVSIGILVYLVTVFDWQRVAAVIGRVRLWYVWPAPLLLSLALYFGGVRWSVLLPHFGVRLRAGEGFLYYLIGNFYGIILPGVIGGDAVRIGICAAVKKKSVADITASVLIERVSGILALLIVGTLAIVLLSPVLRSALGLSVVMSIPLMAGFLLVVLFGSYVLFEKILARWLKNLSAKRSGIAETILRIINDTKKIPIVSMFFIFVLSAVFQFGDILASFFLAKAINIDLPLILFLAIFPIVYILTVLPISLGGLGVREGALAYLLTSVGVLPSDAVMLSFLIYLNRVLVSLIGGALQIIWTPGVSLKEVRINAKRETGDISS